MILEAGSGSLETFIKTKKWDVPPELADEEGKLRLRREADRRAMEAKIKQQEAQKERVAGVKAKIAEVATGKKKEQVAVAPPEASAPARVFERAPVGPARPNLTLGSFFSDPNVHQSHPVIDPRMARTPQAPPPRIVEMQGRINYLPRAQAPSSEQFIASAIQKDHDTSGLIGFRGEEFVASQYLPKVMSLRWPACSFGRPTDRGIPVILRGEVKSYIKWLNQRAESLKPYDILITDARGDHLEMIEVKSSKGASGFCSLSGSELKRCQVAGPLYSLYYVSKVESERPEVTIFENLQQHIMQGSVASELKLCVPVNKQRNRCDTGQGEIYESDIFI